MTKLTAEARRSTSGLLLSTQQWMNSLLDLVFPPQCAGCGRVDYSWCPRCEQQVRNIPIEYHQRHLVGIEIVSTGVHEGKLQDAVHALKYEHVPDMKYLLAERLLVVLDALDWQVTVVAPVPLHKLRFKLRGYNQAELLAHTLAFQLDLPCHADALMRYRDTRSQVGLTRQERLTNVKGAFRGNPALLQDQTLLLIDDVITTGATIAVCARAALAAGAHAVYGLTVSTASSVETAV